MSNLAELVRYTEVADNLVIAAFQSCAPPEKAMALFSHVLNAQHIWASRILGEEILYAPHQLHEVELLTGISSNNIVLLRRILSDFPMDQVVSYTNTLGEQFINAVGDIVFHVVNHSTYHRAQIASELRRSNIAPPVTDFIILKRQGLL